MRIKTEKGKKRGRRYASGSAVAALEQTGSPTSHFKGSVSDTERAKRTKARFVPKRERDRQRGRVDRERERELIPYSPPEGGMPPR